MTNNGNMGKSRSHGLIYLTFPVLHQYIMAALNQLIESIISKYEHTCRKKDIFKALYTTETAMCIYSILLLIGLVRSL